MPVETASLFATVIQEHLELKRRNAALEHEMPLERYMPDDPFENHPLFKTEEQARIEDTMDGASRSSTSRPRSTGRPPRTASPDGAVRQRRRRRRGVRRGGPRTRSLWTRSRDFDWGDCRPRKPRGRREGLGAAVERQSTSAGSGSRAPAAPRTPDTLTPWRS